MASPRSNKEVATAPQPIAGPNPTMALETSDLMSLELAEARVTEVKPVDRGRSEKVERPEPSVVLALEPPPTPGPNRVKVADGARIVVAPIPRAHPRGSRGWIVAVVYLFAAAALALALYERLSA